MSQFLLRSYSVYHYIVARLGHLQKAITDKTRSPLSHVRSAADSHPVPYYSYWTLK